MRTKIGTHARSLFSCLSVPQTSHEWSGGHCDRECRSPHSTRGLPRKRKRPVLTSFDRLFWGVLSHFGSGWRAWLDDVQPDTVVRWQRERFRKFWARLSRTNHRRRGRAMMAVEIRRLIVRMVMANSRWRAPRIHGELKILGIEISERTVSRILRTLRRPPTQTWKIFTTISANWCRSISSVRPKGADYQWGKDPLK